MLHILRKLRSAAPNLALAALVLFVVTPARADGAWVLETVDNAGSSPNDCAWTSLALDAQGVPRVCYSWSVNPRVATRGPSGWTYEQLVTPPHAPAAAAEPAKPASPELLNICYPTIAIDPVSGEPRVAFDKILSSQLWYAERATGGGWSYQYVSFGEGSPQLAMDHQGSPRLMLGADYFTRTNGIWGYEQAGDGSVAPIRLDAQDHPKVLLMGGYPAYSIQYASRETGTWNIENLGGPVGYSSIALDGAGNPCIAYVDGATRSLRYRYLDNGAWVFETVTHAHVGYVSVAIGGGGQPFIAYSDSFGGNHLCFARRSGGPGTPWTTETVDGSYECGYYCSLAIDAAGRPHIGYFESPTRRARYAMLPTAVTAVPTPGTGPTFRLARVFPNPYNPGSRLMLVFSLPGPRKVTVEVLDVAGRVIARHGPAPVIEGLTALPWSPAACGSGLYFIRATTDRGETSTTRFALTR
jgi:hypothetical protein